MRRIVIDANVVLAVIFDEEPAPQIDAVLDQSAVVVPSLWKLEVTNVITVRERQKRIRVAEAEEMLAYVDALPAQIVSEPVDRSALALAAFARPHQLTTYDAVYLDLAVRLGLPLFTLDHNLALAAGRTGVEWLRRISLPPVEDEMMKNSLAAVILSLLFARAAFAESPATRPGVFAPDGLTAVVRVWPADPPATGPADPEDVIKLYGKPVPNGYGVAGVKRANLSVFLPPNAAGPTPAAIVCPGGGYTAESVTDEGFRVARRLAEHGVAAFVLKYRLPDGRVPPAGALPVPQQDVLRAIQSVRADADKWRVDPNRVGVIGFSAGGHLAASAATMFDEAGSFADLAGRDAVSRQPARPDFAVLMYPVITLAPGLTHGGSRKALIGADADAADTDRFSADARVTKDTPPLLIVHAEDDKVVPVANALRMATAAATAGVPCELVLLSKGGHGFGLGRPGAENGVWFDHLLGWLKVRKVLP